MQNVHKTLSIFSHINKWWLINGCCDNVNDNYKYEFGEGFYYIRKKIKNKVNNCLLVPGLETENILQRGKVRWNKNT